MIDKNYFGKPNEGIHSYRIFGLAAVDVAMTLGASYLISQQLNTNFYKTSAVVFAAGIAAHHYVGVETELNKKLGL